MAQGESGRMAQGESGRMAQGESGRTAQGESGRMARRVSSLVKRQLVRQLVDDELRQGRLNHFGPIASTSGLLDLVCDFIRQMKRLEIWPEQFAEACQKWGVAEKDRELLAIYRAYQQTLLDYNLYDAEGCFWSARDLLRLDPIRYELVIADGFSDFTRTEHDMLQDLASHAGEMWISLLMEGRVASIAVQTHHDSLGGSSLRSTPPYSTGRPDLFQEGRVASVNMQTHHDSLGGSSLRSTPPYFTGRPDLFQEGRVASRIADPP